jgi:hypothetical protein
MKVLFKLAVLCTVNGTLIDGICNQHDCDLPTYVLHHNSTGETNNSTQYVMITACLELLVHVLAGWNIARRTRNLLSRNCLSTAFKIVVLSQLTYYRV